MGQKKRAVKGEINITNCEGRIRLRWTFRGERYSLSLPYPYLPENLPSASIKATQIKLDILSGSFDPTLKKYEDPNSSKIGIASNDSEKQDEIPSCNPSLTNIQVGLTEKFNDWCRNIRNVDVDNSVDYLYVRKLLVKWEGVEGNEFPGKLNNQNWAKTTYNRRLNTLKLFFTWLYDTKVINNNPLKDVLRKRINKKQRNPRRKPLTETQINNFLNVIKNDTYCPNGSRFKHSFYYPFVSFIFITGVRNAEAIGLRVKHINFTKGYIEISETLARTVKGSHHAARIQKSTKTENERYIPLTRGLRQILGRQIKGKSPNDLMFPSPYGLSIDDRMLQRRTIKPILRKMGIGNRDLYSARHAFGTRCVQQGMPLTELAYLLGHSTIETASRNYVSVEKPKVNLPSLSTRRTLKSRKKRRGITRK